MMMIPSYLSSRSWQQAAFFLIFAGCMTVQNQAQAQTQAGGTTGQQEVGGTALGGLTPEEVFSGGVERSGVVGQSTATPAGASAASTAGAAAGGTTRGGLSGFGGGGGGLGAAFGNLFGNNNGGGTDAGDAIRTRLRGAVTLPPSAIVSEAELNRRAAGHLYQSTSLGPIASGPNSAGRFRGVNVSVEGRTAVLTGSVASEADRRMTHLMMRLEPGVSTVQNRIQLAP
ncbi:BON domain-containing protein [Neorhodopirellula lusitana]|uniref:BON domain-containing protein n=1 Tax=Neorhodopirellula lusitana TaxID=445327 RepID=A0ABY1PY83_9BACT|nr:BON domain-containing protein [Neorhodopirellula lusitana]SMP52913.1 BON domain-containing protein [Neorhodopirellula lusitana]